MTTLRTYLASLPANPLDTASPPLYVADGDLSDAGKAHVTHPDYKGYPYAMIYGIRDLKVQRYHGGTAKMLTPLDVVLEMRSPADMDVMIALWARAYEAPKFVDEAMPGVPLKEALEYSGGFRPMVLTAPNDWVQGALTFSSHWLGRY